MHTEISVESFWKAVNRVPHEGMRIIRISLETSLNKGLQCTLRSLLSPFGRLLTFEGMFLAGKITRKHKWEVE